MDKYHRKSTPRPPPASETHASIRSQTEAFIRHGGSIKTIPRGHTGLLQMAGPGQLTKMRDKGY